MFIIIVTTISATVTRYARIDVMLVENSVLKYTRSSLISFCLKRQLRFAPPPSPPSSSHAQ